jgi:glucose uptake protein GlcU
MSQPIEFTNLLKYNTVNEFLGSVLSWLQGIVAILALVMIVIGGFLYITSAGDSSRTEIAKKCILAAVIGFAIAIAAPSFLREIGTILGWGPAATNLPPGVGTSLSLLQIFGNVLNFLLSIVGIVAIIMIVVGAIMYLTAAGDEDRLDTGKSIVKYAMIGIFVALASLVIVRQLANLF